MLPRVIMMLPKGLGESSVVSYSRPSHTYRYNQHLQPRFLLVFNSLSITQAVAAQSPSACFCPAKPVLCFHLQLVRQSLTR